MLMVTVQITLWEIARMMMETLNFEDDGKDDIEGGGEDDDRDRVV